MALALHALDAPIPGRHGGAGQEEWPEAWQEWSLQTLGQRPRWKEVMALIAESVFFSFDM